MLFSTLNLLSVAVLFSVALWCIFNPAYDDGIIGKMIFIFLALSCYATLVDYPNPPNEFTHTAMTCSIAASALREFVITRINPVIFRRKTKEILHD